MDARSEDLHQPVIWSVTGWCFVVLLATVALWGIRPPRPVAASAPETEFSAERALVHVRAIARRPHPAGSSANEEVKAYLVAQLSTLALNPQVLPATGVYVGRRDIVAGNTQDIVGRLPGSANSRAVMLMAHYDSVATAPGAADDGAGVAAILESVRAIRAGPGLKNDLIVLFTDGEEAGLLGAEAFAASNPWMHDIGLVLNFEARGDQGASLLFETSRNNSVLMETVAASANHPIGSSLFYSLYRLLPNDTDFTIFRPLQIPGLNFAFGGNLEAYHSRLDSVENLDLGSLQQHGLYALALSRRFGQMDLGHLRQGGDDVFFNWLGSSFSAYRERWIIPGEILATILLIWVVLLTIRRAETGTVRILMALGPSIAILIAVPLVMVVAAFLLSLILAGRVIAGDSPANSLLLTGLVLLGACTASALLAVFRKRFPVQDLFLAGLIVVWVISWGIALTLPGGSYLLFWPLLLAAAGLLAIVVMKRHGQSRDYALGNLAGTALAVLLFAPFVYLLYVFLMLQLLTVAVIGLLLGLFFLLCTPWMNVSVPQGKWRPVAITLLISGLAGIGIGASIEHPSAQYPRRDTLVYSLNTDDHSAAWVSYDRSPDRWTKRFFSNRRPQLQAAPEYLGGSDRRVMAASTDPLNLAPPVAEIQEDRKEGSTHHLRIHVRSQRNAGTILVAFGKDVRVKSLRIDGRDITPRENLSSFRLTLIAMNSEGADLSLTANAPSGVSFWLMDETTGLPAEAPPRPSDLMPGFNSDLTLVSRKYSL